MEQYNIEQALEEKEACSLIHSKEKSSSANAQE
jgi:hypothetical protein